MNSDRKTRDTLGVSRVFLWGNGFKDFKALGELPAPERGGAGRASGGMGSQRTR